MSSSGCAITRTSIQLLWDASTDDVAIESYRIYRDGKLVGTVTAGNIAQGFNSTGLKANTSYRFTVQAIDKQLYVNNQRVDDAAYVVQSTGAAAGLTSTQINRPITEVVFGQRGLIADASLAGAKYSRIIR